MVRLTVVPVIPLARSDAMKTATSATSRERHHPPRVGRARRGSAWNCSQVSPARLELEDLPHRLVSGMPCGRRPTTRMPVRRELGGQVARERLLGGLRRAVAAVAAACPSATGAR